MSDSKNTPGEKASGKVGETTVHLNMSMIDSSGRKLRTFCVTVSEEAYEKLMRHRMTRN